MTGQSPIESAHYPQSKGARDRWILSRRGDRAPVDPEGPHGFIREYERCETGQIVETLTIFLTNRECPWRCVMCDLWKTTLVESVPIGAIPRQIDYAFAQLKYLPGTSPADDGTPRQLKLYNGGSFFDPRAVPVEDYPAIASRTRGFNRVIVECHPAFVGRRCLEFVDAMTRAAALPQVGRAPDLEVAMGLETVEPTVLERLNKGMTLDLFQQSARFLRDHGISLRAFVLVKPPFLDENAALNWAQRSIEFAFDADATVVSLIPTRGGNGAMEALQAAGHFSPPRLATLEQAQAAGISLQRGRVFADLWGLEQFSDCPKCFAARLVRLQTMNHEQRVLAAVSCPNCGGLSEATADH